MKTTPPGKPSTGHPFLAGGGEMAALVAAHDWAATGYAESSAVGNGLLEAGMEVLTKPFAIAALVAKVGGLVQREAA